MVSSTTLETNEKQHFEIRWYVYASMKWVIGGSDNELLRSLIGGGAALFDNFSRKHEVNSSTNILDSWWRHQMETFSALLVICAGFLPVTGEFPKQRPATRTSIFSRICGSKNGWVNKRFAGDLILHRVHYDVTVIYI